MKTLHEMVADQQAEMSKLAQQLDRLGGPGTAETFKTKVAEKLISHYARLLSRRPDKLENVVRRLRAGDLNGWELRVPMLEEISRLAQPPLSPPRLSPPPLPAPPLPAPAEANELAKYYELLKTNPASAGAFFSRNADLIFEQKAAFEADSRQRVKREREMKTKAMQDRSRRLE
jgi:HAMP domain-containing protein